MKFILDFTMRWHVPAVMVAFVPYASYKLGAAYNPATLPAFVSTYLYPRLWCDLAYLREYGNLDPERFVSALINGQLVAIILGPALACYLALHWQTYRRQFASRLDRAKTRAGLMLCAAVCFLALAYITLAVMPSSRAWGGNCSMFADPDKWSRRHSLAPSETVFFMVGLMCFMLYLLPAMILTGFKLSKEKTAERAEKLG